MVRRKATANTERRKGRNGRRGTRVGNADGAVNGSLAAAKVVTALGQPGIRKEIVKADVAERGLAGRADN